MQVTLSIEDAFTAIYSKNTNYKNCRNSHYDHSIEKAIVNNLHKTQSEFLLIKMTVLNYLETIIPNYNHCHNLQNDILILTNMVEGAKNKSTIKTYFRIVKTELLCLSFKAGDGVFDDRCYNCNVLAKYHHTTIDKTELELLQNLRNIFIKVFNKEM